MLAAGCIYSIDASAQAVDGTGALKAHGPVPEMVDGSSVTLRKAPQSVSLTVSDSSIAYILRALAQQARISISFDRSNPAFEKKMSVKLSDTDIKEAFATVLKDVGMVATLTANGETVVVRPRPVERKDTAEGKERGSITGRVLDSATGKGVEGVTVLIEGNKISAVTNDQGIFILRNVPLGEQRVAVKVFGYHQERRSFSVGDSEPLNVTFRLRPVATALNEVVTTAVGQQRRMEVGNDIVKINAPQVMERAPVRSVTDLLKHAQVPGVQVLTANGEPGAPTRIRMRGIGSISQSTDPAIIVDGVWVSSDMSSGNIVNQAINESSGTDGSPSGSGRYGGAARFTPSPLDNIDPAAIESIEVIRGPSAASLYGQEAANGVIVITTKRGRAGETAWSYSYDHDWDSQTRAKFPQWVSYGTAANGVPVNGCSIIHHYGRFCLQDSVFNLNSFGSLLDETGPASNYRHSFSVRGGVSAITYSFSASFQNQLGTDRTVPADIIRLRMLDIPFSRGLKSPTEDSRVFLNSSLAFNPTQKLNFDLSVNATNSNLRQDGVQMSGGLNEFLGYWDTLGVLNHSAAQVDLFLGGSKSFSIQSALRAQYAPGRWWTAGGQLGIDHRERIDHRKSERRQCDRGVCKPMPTEGLRRSINKTDVLTARASVSGIVSTRLDRFLTVRPSVGFDVRRNIDDRVTFGLRDILGADQASGAGDGNITGRDIITAGYYISTAFRILDRLSFDLGWRQDAGSVIKANSSSRYPKLATSWLISDEGFFPTNSFISQLRLRGAVGYAAVHPTEADLYGQYMYGQSIINGVQVTIGTLNSIGNNRLVPERSFESEGGFDTDLFGDRIQMIFTVAHKVLRNAIVERELPNSAGSSGQARRKENVARVDNRSVEVSFDSRVIDNDLMLLQFHTGLANVNNVIKNLGSNVLPSSNLSTSRLAEGYQIGSVWYRPILGYGDVDQNGFIDASEILLGDTTVYQGWNQPKLTASYRVSLSLLNRNLRIDASFSQNGSRIQRLTYQDNYGIEVVGAPVSDQAVARASAITNGFAVRTSDVRWTSSSISYNLPTAFTRRLNAKLITVSFQGSNLGLWTDYSGRDPMVNSSPIGNNISDNGFTLPTPRRYAFNVRLNW